MDLSAEIHDLRASKSLEEARRACWDQDDWDQGVEYCLEFIRPEIDSLFSDSIIVDVGCGVGRLLAPLAEDYISKTFFGLDASRHMLSHLRPLPNVIPLLGSWMNVPFCDMAYSVLTFQHLEPEVQRSYIKILSERIGIGGTFILQWVPDGEPGEINHPVSVSKMVQWLTEYGFRIPYLTLPEKYPWAWVKATWM